ncbi:hypothetical protein [Roseivirga pacifica]|uniref:hypothetical protein n=1 Tax=Roseivirga pacifica TaxID=1267423 RepID=UPI00227BE0B4|nr:hypothetical protein [Roseivirga pacifica]
MTKQINYLLLSVFLVFSIGCETGITEDIKPFRGEVDPCDLDPTVECDIDDDDGGGDGGTPGGSPNDYLKIYGKGQNSYTINIARSVNSINGWSNYQSLPSNHRSAQGLSAVFFNDKEYIFHVSPSSDEVQVSHETSSGWTQQSIAQNVVRTNRTPSATVWNNKIYMAYKSLNSNAVYMVHSTNPQATTWSSPVRIITSTENYGKGSNASDHGNPPYLTVFNDQLYVFWTKLNTGKVYYRMKPSESLPWEEEVDITASSLTYGDMEPRAGGVSAQEFNGKLYAAYISWSNYIIFRQILPETPKDTYTSGFNLSAKSSHRISMTVFDNKLLAVYKGAQTNNIYYSYWDGNTWYGNSGTGTGGTIEAPAVLHYTQ